LLLIALTLSLTSRANTDLNALYQESRELIRVGKYEQCKSLLDTLIPRLPAMLRANSYSDLAVCYKHLGEINSADKAFRSAIGLASKGVSREKILLNYSNFQIETGSYAKALETLSEVNTESLIPHKLINMAHARYYADDGDITAAVALLDSCIALETVSPELRRIALQNKGFYFMDNAEYARALECFNRVAANIKDKDEYYQCLGNVAITEAHVGRLEDAEKNIETVCRWFANRGQEDYRIALRKGGEIYHLAGDLKKSKQYYHTYFNRERASIIERLPNLSTELKLSIWEKEKPLLSKCFMLEDNDAEFLFEVAMFRRQTSLLGMHDIAGLKALLSVKPSDVRKRLKRDEVAMEFISYTDISGAEQYAAIILPAVGKARFVKLFPKEDIYNLHVGKYSIYDAIKVDSSEAKNLLYNSETVGNHVWAPIIAALPERATKIYFAPEGVMHFLGIENLNFSGRDRYELHRISSTASLINRGEKRKTGNMLVVGGLDYSNIPADSAVENPDHEAAAMLGKRFGKVNLFDYLPGTRSEADSIGRKIKSTVCHEMGEGNLKNIMPNYSIVHIATHGYSLDMGIRKRPQYMADSIAVDVSLLSSGLALTGANIASNNAQMEDGLLSARELCDLDLSSVDFVILSACQTAQGDVTDEGAAGMVRGLKNAGVKTIIATLWSVNDVSTSSFMQKFYELLSAGVSKTAAFRAAQESLRTEKFRFPYRKFDAGTMARSNKVSYYSRNFSAPYYWAPFILIDDY
jgi:CHAT domain-containing protein/tetratricopeptide (TPR) repeat protein